MTLKQIVENLMSAINYFQVNQSQAVSTWKQSNLLAPLKLQEQIITMWLKQLRCAKL